MIICIIGKSGSGKDSLARLISQNTGIPKMVSYTTRKKRQNEIEGIDHHFISAISFIKKTLTHKMVTKTLFSGHWYGIDKQLLKKNKNWIYVIDRVGYDQLIKKLGKNNVKGVFVECDEHIRILRMKQRGDDIHDVFSRISHDRKAYKNVASYCDIKVNSNQNKLSENAKKIQSYIKYLNLK